MADSTVSDDQLWFQHPEMQARVTQAEDDFVEGRSTRTKTPEEAQEYLDRLKAIEEFERTEEVLEDHGLARLMDKTEDTEGDDLLSGEAAKEYYETLKDALER